MARAHVCVCVSVCVCVCLCVCGWLAVSLCRSLVYVRCVCVPLVYLGCVSLVYLECVCECVCPPGIFGGYVYVCPWYIWGVCVCVHVRALVYVVCVGCVFCVVYVERCVWCGVWLGLEAGTGVNGPSISRTLVYLGSVGAMYFVWCM